ncbi:Beta-glucosidase 1B [Pleurostoma richardsiae]|uniref:Beta-glucosidase 1B n=1 Tax=Pleurostoma richardsiae TaxID=41990 RepID=A0AA38VB60_9PEZI|nr:Beta-glucosidase 1B [Pleurostoma richardsiae]
MPVLLLVASYFAVALAQQVYVPVQQAVAPRPDCSANAYSRQGGKVYADATPATYFTEFSFTLTATIRTATSATPGPRTMYAPPYEALSDLVPDLSTTTWGNYDPNATTRATDTEDPYGQAAWTRLWERTTFSNWTTRGIYSTTVLPTPVPTSELVLPPPAYFGPRDCYYLPENFIFGVAGSAPQMEGAIADEGRSPGLLELPISSSQGSDTNFVANEFYYLYKQDIERLASMGVEYFSFSISWTRILPFAVPGTPVNQQGLDHYDDLINFVIAKGMKPVVTLYHFDTPLQFYNNLTHRKDAHIGVYNGGYDNSTFEDAFVHYGKIIMTHFADRVPIWFTWNEPVMFAANGKSVDTVIKSHARLFHFYQDEIRGQGKVSLKLSITMGMPMDPQNASHVLAAAHYNDFQAATFANPIMLGIDYPDAYKMAISDYIPLTMEDLAYIRGTADIFAVDAYAATVVSPPSSGNISTCATNISDSLFPYCVQLSTLDATGWDIGYRSESFVYTTPLYLRVLLNYLWNTFRKPVLITEFGFPVFGEADKTPVDQLFDTPRSEYYLSAMSEVLKTIWDDGVDVMGAFAWSFADNWEFGHYYEQFGIQMVDRTTQLRKYKRSFFDLVDFVKTRTKRKITSQCSAE